MKKTLVLIPVVLTLAACGAGQREDRYQNVAVRGRETDSAFVINMPKSFDNVAVKCLPAAPDPGVWVVFAARSSGGLSVVHADNCPADVAKAEASK